MFTFGSFFAGDNPLKTIEAAPILTFAKTSEASDVGASLADARSVSRDFEITRCLSLPFKVALARLSAALKSAAKTYGSLFVLAAQAGCFRSFLHSTTEYVIVLTMPQMAPCVIA
jgi:hypothetical protein